MQLYLLDTHAFIWFVNGSSELSPLEKKCIEADNATNFISIASIWEIAIKISLNKLELRAPFTEISKQIADNNFKILSITIEDALTVAKLPFYHRDPFDRMIIAQAYTKDLTIITKDEQFKSYEVKTI